MAIETDKVVELILGVVVMIIIVVVLWIYAPQALKDFLKMLGLYNTNENDLINAAKCAYLRCHDGCIKSTELKNIVFHTDEAGNQPNCKGAFCNPDFEDSEGKICDDNADQFPVEVYVNEPIDFTVDSFKDMGGSNVGPSCILTDGWSTTGVMDANDNMLFIHIGFLPEKSTEQCKAKNQFYGTVTSGSFDTTENANYPIAFISTHTAAHVPAGLAYANSYTIIGSDSGYKVFTSTQTTNDITMQTGNNYRAVVRSIDSSGNLAIKKDSSGKLMDYAFSLLSVNGGQYVLQAKMKGGTCVSGSTTCQQVAFHSGNAASVNILNTFSVVMSNPQSDKATFKITYLTISPTSQDCSTLTSLNCESPSYDPHSGTYTPSGCQWCPACSGPMSNGYDSAKCVQTGACLYACKKDTCNPKAECGSTNDCGSASRLCDLNTCLCGLPTGSGCSYDIQCHSRTCKPVNLGSSSNQCA
jgi:hypothetical protein